MAIVSVQIATSIPLNPHNARLIVYGTTSDWGSYTGIADSGAICVDTTTGDIRFGDGVNTWSGCISIGGGGANGGVWGTITGTLADQTDLQGVLDNKETLGAASSAVSAHEAAGDPHPTYLTASEGGAAYQPLDSDLTTIAANITAAGHALLDDASASVQRTTLGLEIGVNVQAQDAELACIAGLTSAADKLPYFTGSGTAAVATFTGAARNLLDDTDAATMLTTLVAQAALVSGTNIKTINGDSVLGSGDLVVSGAGGLSQAQVLARGLGA